MVRVILWRALNSIKVLLEAEYRVELGEQPKKLFVRSPRYFVFTIQVKPQVELVVHDLSTI